MQEKKAKKPIILAVGKKGGFCDYFVICSAETHVQVEAITDWVLKKSRELNYEPHHLENDLVYSWVLIDFFDVVLHIFTDQLRAFYNLEYLWRGVPKVRLPKK